MTIVSGTGGRYRSHRKLHFDGGRIRTRGRPTQRALLDEHFRIIGRKKLYYSIKAMQAEPDDCLVHADDGYGRPVFSDIALEGSATLQMTGWAERRSGVARL